MNGMAIAEPRNNLHLDTARLGCLCPDGLDALQSFGRLLAAHGRMPKFAAVLGEGFSGLPDRIQRDFPGLRFWSGLKGLQRTIAGLVVEDPAAFVLFSAQSTSLIVFAAHVLSRRARRILCSDLEFPLVLGAIREIQAQYTGGLEILPLRRLVEEDGCDADDLARSITGTYLRSECDALVLSQVTQHGIRIPCERIVREIRSLDPGAIIMIDGAQGVGLELSHTVARQADIYFGVGHKWLEGSSLAFAVAPREASVGLIKATLNDLVERYVVTDPYLRVAAHMSGLLEGRMYETISLEQLFVAAAACSVAAARGETERAQRFDSFLDFSKTLEVVARGTGAGYRRRHPSLRTGITVIDWSEAVAAGPMELEARLGTTGIVATGLSEKSIRISAPTGDFPASAWGCLESALGSIPKGR
jgi:hypothetical protein